MKALIRFKAVLTAFRIRFPHTHSLSELLTLVEQVGQAIPERVRESARLSDYAVEARYPGLAEPVTQAEGICWLFSNLNILESLK